MLITLNQMDLCKIIASSINFEGKATIEVGIIDGEIVGVLAVDQELPSSLKQASDFPQLADAASEAKGSNLVNMDILAAGAPSSEEEEEEDDNNPPANGTEPKKRKRRTKAEIEADRLAEEQAQAEAAAEATEAVTPQEATAEPEVEPEEANPFAEMETPATSTGAGFNEIAAEAELDSDTPPFDIDEGATVRAEAELLPEAKEAAVEATDANDPFADMGVSSAGDELFAQPDNVAVTSVTKQQDGFVEPAVENNDPFAAFN